jgi:hypothetical protein
MRVCVCVCVIGSGWCCCQSDRPHQNNPPSTPPPHTPLYKPPPPPPQQQQTKQTNQPTNQRKTHREVVIGVLHGRVGVGPPAVLVQVRLVLVLLRVLMRAQEEHVLVEVRQPREVLWVLLLCVWSCCVMFGGMGGVYVWLVGWLVREGFVMCMGSCFCRIFVSWCVCVFALAGLSCVCVVFVSYQETGERVALMSYPCHMARFPDPFVT